ncbi:MAG: hypothetical protein Q7K33_01075 [Candidatus Berkelbacteria bacterium]|nr:hypothetical protein [Candidatus Berkelbacteria bacterium]
MREGTPEHIEPVADNEVEIDLSEIISPLKAVLEGFTVNAENNLERACQGVVDSLKHTIQELERRDLTRTGIYSLVLNGYSKLFPMINHDDSRPGGIGIRNHNDFQVEVRNILELIQPQT